MRVYRTTIVAVLGAGIGLAFMAWSSAGYLTGKGFPIDAAWTYAVYGRAFAESGLLAYNPGESNAGVVSLVWAALMGLPHLVADGPKEMLMATKAMGGAFHVMAVVLAVHLIPRREVPGPVERAAAVGLGGLLVALHPDLLAGSVSGLEVPMATAATFFVAWASSRRRPLLVGAAVGLAVLIRPSIAAVGWSMPILMYGGDESDATVRQLVATTVGGAVGGVVLVWRTLVVTGQLLPGPFLARPTVESWSQFFGQVAASVGAFAVFGSSLLVAAGFVIAVGFCWRRSTEDLADRLLGAVFLSGGVATVVSAFIFPSPESTGIGATRFLLPGLALMLWSLPGLVYKSLQRLESPQTRWGVFGGLAFLAVVSIGIDLPERSRRLAESTQRIDKLQLQIGRALAEAPPRSVVWVGDPGVIRYFGRPYVVDLTGRNTPVVLGRRAQAYLDDHPPSFIERVPGQMSLDRVTTRELPAKTFNGLRSSEAYLIVCRRPGHRGKLEFGGRTHKFRCSISGRPSEP